MEEKIVQKWHFCNEEFHPEDGEHGARSMGKNQTRPVIRILNLSPLSFGAVVAAVIVCIVLIVSLVIALIIYKRKKRAVEYDVKDFKKHISEATHNEETDALILEAISKDIEEETESNNEGVCENQMDAQAVDIAGKILADDKKPLAARFRALFLLRNVKSDQAVQWISKCFSDPSALLKHELAFCLGQMQNRSAIPCLVKVLEDVDQEAMVRHEAAEALGAIGDPSVIEVLTKYSNDEVPEVAETCVLALNRVKWVQHPDLVADEKQSIYNSVDPAPPAKSEDVKDLASILVNENKSLWDRYRAMFSLRNINSDEAVCAISKGLYCKKSALFRHEIAYVLGQIQSPLAIPALSDRLRDSDESGMVRHECAEALGAIATDSCQELLRQYATDRERVVRESCEIALDMTEHEKSNEFQYAMIK